MIDAKVLQVFGREVVFYDFDHFRLDVKGERLLKDGDPVPITHKAFQVLLILVQNFEQTVEKENIYQQLWGDSFVEDANLTQHIYVLRKALGHQPSGAQYIETVARLGYRFSANVATVHPPALELVQEADSREHHPKSNAYVRADPAPAYLKVANRETLDESTRLDSIRGGSNWRFRTRVIFAVALIVLVGLVALGITLRLRTSPPVDSQPKSIAVLPFTPIGEQSRDEKLGLGMADAIITRLSKLKEVPVRPTSAVAHYTDQPAQNSIEAGKQLGVETVLEGTVQQDQDRIRVSVRLINVADGRSIWAENLDENSSNIFSVQDSISKKIVGALEVKLTTDQTQALSQHATSSPEAYQAFQLGLYFANMRSKDGLEKALTYLQNAIEIDPKYAGAYALLADTYNMLGYYSFADRDEMYDKSRMAAEKAVALDNTLADAYVALAFLPPSKRSDKRTSKELIEHAIELSPYNSNARIRYAWMLLGDDVNKTVEQMRLAQQLDPLSPISNGALCNGLVLQNNVAEAVRFCEKAVELAAEGSENRVLLADTYFLTGRTNDAIEQIQKRIDEAPRKEKFSAYGSLAYYYARLGRRAEAEKLLQLIKSETQKDPMLLNDLALVSYALDKRNDGFAYFEQAYHQHVFPYQIFRYSPIWEPARSDERISSFLKASQSQSTNLGRTDQIEDAALFQDGILLT